MFIVHITVLFYIYLFIYEVAPRNPSKNVSSKIYCIRNRCSKKCGFFTSKTLGAVVFEHPLFQATKMFQKLGFINTILSDPEKRKLYDATGDLGVASEELDMDKVKMWREYFDTLFKPVTEEDVCTWQIPCNCCFTSIKNALKHPFAPSISLWPTAPPPRTKEIISTPKNTPLVSYSSFQKMRHPPLP